MFRYFVFERITDPSWAERPDEPESFASLIPSSIAGISSFTMNSTKYSMTRIFYVAGNRPHIDHFIGSMTGTSAETHRIWECIAFLGYLAARKAFKKEGRLLYERLTSTDVEQQRQEDLAGQAMLVAHESGASMEGAMAFRKSFLEHLNAKATNK